MKKLILIFSLYLITTGLFAQVTKSDIEIRKTTPVLKLNGTGAVIDFYNNDVRITHSSNLITLTGGGLTVEAGQLIKTGTDTVGTKDYSRTAVGDSIAKRLSEATVGLSLADKDVVWASPTYIQDWFATHSSGPYDRLLFTIGVTTGAPTVADSLLEDSKLRGKYIKIFRSGTYETQHYATVNTEIGFWQLGDSAIVNPVFQDNEQIIVEIYDPIAWNNVDLEGQESVLLDSLAVYYKLDETTGTSGKDANNIQDIYCNPSTTPTPTNAKFNYNRHIGYKGYMRIPANVNVNPDTLFTVSTWIWADSIGASTADYIFAITNSSTPYLTHRAYIDTDGKILFRTYNSESTQYTSISTAAISDSTAYHVVFVHEGNGKTNKIYVNGVNVTTSMDANYTFSGTLHSTDSYIYFGNSTTLGAYNFRGYMDECAIWYQRFTQADVTLLYNSTTSHPFTE